MEHHFQRKGDIKIGVVGGDQRQLSAACAFARTGYETAVFGLDVSGGEIENATRCATLSSVMNGADAVLLPLPYTTDGRTLNCPMCRCEVPLDAVFKAASEGGVACLYGGMLDPAAYQAGEKYGFSVVDYYRFEGLCEKNAAATAEAAVAMALSETKQTLFDARTLVIGYGRVGRHLAKLLKDMGSDVTVAARSEKALAVAAVNGCRALPMGALRTGIAGRRVIFNTVPVRVCGKAEIGAADAGTVYLELASQSGIDEGFAAGRLRVVPAPSLPGRVVPISAGRFIMEAVEADLPGRLKGGRS